MENNKTVFLFGTLSSGISDRLTLNEDGTFEFYGDNTV